MFKANNDKITMQRLLPVLRKRTNFWLLLNTRPIQNVPAAKYVPPTKVHREEFQVLNLTKINVIKKIKSTFLLMNPAENSCTVLIWPDSFSGFVYFG